MKGKRSKNTRGIGKGSLVGVVVVIIVVIAAIALFVSMQGRSPSTVPSTSQTSSMSSSVPSTSSPSQLPPIPLPQGTVNINLITFSGKSAQFLTYAAQQFHKLYPNYTVNVVQEPFSNYISVEKTSLASHSNQYTILGFTSTSALGLQPYLLTLNSSYFNMSDLIQNQEEFGGYYYNSSTGTQVIGLVYETAVYLMAYNPNIFNNQTLAEEFFSQYHMNFSPTTYQNWTVVLDVDQFLVSHNITKYGFLIDDHEAHGIIDAYPAVYGWYYSRNSSLNAGNPAGLPNFNIMFQGKVTSGLSYPLPSFNSTSGVEALQVYKELVSYEPNPSQIQISYDNLAEFYNQSPGAFLFTSQLSGLKTKYSISTLPGGYAETGTDFLGINKYSTPSQVAVAELYLRFILSPQMQEVMYYNFGKFPASKTAFQQILGNSSLSSTDLFNLKQVYKAALEAYANPPNIPPTYTSLIPDFNNLIFQYITGQTNDPTQVLDQAAREWATVEAQYYG